jgi:hypothetical protein
MSIMLFENISLLRPKRSDLENKGVCYLYKVELIRTRSYIDVILWPL